MSYYGPERRSGATLSDEELEAIAEKIAERVAEKAAEKALEKVYADVGRSIMNKALWLIGACGIAVLLWMGGKGLKP